MKRISVCMATYNGESFIYQQLKSIVNQLGADDEIVISDDSSTDNTVRIVESMNDPRIKLLPSKRFSSAVLNFEYTLTHATGKYIFLADQDDIWFDNKVYIMLNALESTDLAVSDCTFINATGETIGASYFQVYNSGVGFAKNFIKNTYLGNCMAFRRELLERILPFPEQLYQASKLALYHDVWIGLIANLWFRVQFIPVPLSAYRRHTNNASPTHLSAKSPNSLLTKFKSRWLLASGLLNRAIATR